MKMKTRSILSMPTGEIKGSGSESNVYSILDGYYKKFKFFVSRKERLGKRRKLLYLEQFKYLKDYYPNIYYFVSSYLAKTPIKGYVMEPITGKHLNKDTFTFEEKIILLKLLRNIIEQFNEAGIYYHDIRIPNLLVREQKQIVLLDIDSIVTDEDPKLDVVPFALRSYLGNGGVVGTGAQIIMFNNLTGKVLDREIEDDENFAMDKEAYMIENDIYFNRVDCVADHEYLYEHIKRL